MATFVDRPSQRKPGGRPGYEGEKDKGRVGEYQGERRI